MRRRAHGAVVVIVALASALGACSDDAADEAGPTTVTTALATTTTTAAPAGPRTPEQRAADAEVAQAALLTLDDLPAGYRTIADDDGTDDIDAEGLAACLGIDPALLEDGQNPEAESPDFESPDGDRISSTVEIAGSADEAAGMMAVIRQADTPTCIAQLFEQLIANPPEGEEQPPGVSFGSVSAQAIEAPALGDESAAFEMTVPITGEGFSLDLYVVFVSARVGRALVDTAFTTDGEPFPLDEAAALTQLVVDRIPRDP